MKWMPKGWWVKYHNEEKPYKDKPYIHYFVWGYHAGADGIKEIKSTRKFLSSKDAKQFARKALRIKAYEKCVTICTKYHCHSKVNLQDYTLCGIHIKKSSEVKHSLFINKCKKCEKILHALTQSIERKKPNL